MSDQTVATVVSVIGGVAVIVLNQWRDRKAAEQTAKENAEKLEKAAKEHAEKAEKVAKENVEKTEKSIAATAETASTALSQAIMAVAKVQQFGEDVDVIRKMLDGDQAKQVEELKAAKVRIAELEKLTIAQQVPAAEQSAK